MAINRRLNTFSRTADPFFERRVLEPNPEFLMRDTSALLPGPMCGMESNRIKLRDKRSFVDTLTTPRSDPESSVWSFFLGKI